MRSLVLGLGLVLAAPVLPASATTQPHATPSGPTVTTAQAATTLRVSRIATGLDHPWDVRSIGNGRYLFTERTRATLSVLEEGRVRRVSFPSDQVWTSGETGLMGLEVDPNYAANRRVYTCQGGYTGNGGHDVRVVAWRLDTGATAATKVRTLLSGIPATSGRHGGCRLLIAEDGSMYVGTGDAAVGRNPRSLTSLGGKVLRLDRVDGSPWPSNRWIRSAYRAKRYLHSFGHRNVQGLAQRADGTVWSVEQGSYRDDEVNRLVKGGDYGWNPVPGYDESVPMTDSSLPGTQYGARWRSGDPTVATSGAEWVPGSRWGGYGGALAVAALKAQRVLFLRFDSAGRLTSVSQPEALQRYGRLRSVTRAGNGDLILTTDNGGGEDALLRVTPSQS